MVLWQFINTYASWKQAEETKRNVLILRIISRLSRFANLNTEPVHSL